MLVPGSGAMPVPRSRLKPGVNPISEPSMLTADFSPQGVCNPGDRGLQSTHQCTLDDVGPTPGFNLGHVNQ